MVKVDSSKIVTYTYQDSNNALHEMLRMVAGALGLLNVAPRRLI